PHHGEGGRRNGVRVRHLGDEHAVIGTEHPVKALQPAAGRLDELRYHLSPVARMLLHAGDGIGGIREQDHVLRHDRTSLGLILWTTMPLAQYGGHITLHYARFYINMCEVG